MQAEIRFLAPAGYFHRQIVRQNIRLLMGHAAGLGSRHVRTVPDGVDVIPLGSESVVVDPDAGLSISQTANKNQPGVVIFR